MPGLGGGGTSVESVDLGGYVGDFGDHVFDEVLDEDVVVETGLDFGLEEGEVVGRAEVGGVGCRVVGGKGRKGEGFHYRLFVILP